MKAVILAGGKGTRLKPYTTIFPKSLMPIGDKPILEIVVQQLKTSGFDEIIITVGHLGELIMAFFGNGSKFGVKIKYSKEDQPLGTAGPLALLTNELSDTFLMMNGDVLTTLDYSNLVDYHKRNGAIATVALKRREIYIDFGIAELDSNNNLKDYTEKPSASNLVSMGVYVFQPEVLKYIAPNKYLDFPNLIKRLIANREKVKGYIFDGYWLDIGRPEDYEKANEEIEEIYDQLGLDVK